jgi:hypothetical protein
MNPHTVRQGECLTSIAEHYGFFWDTLWNLPENSALKQSREDPNTLLSGDIVQIPDKTMKKEMRPTGARHSFRKKGIPARLRMRLLFDGSPRANLPVTISIDGIITKGNTDGDGKLEVLIPPNARTGLLRVGTGDDLIEYELDLGHLDPVSEVTGMQGRLNNLGFDCGAVDGEFGDRSVEALMAFQKSNGLEPTGAVDDATREKLLGIHDAGE